MFYFSDFYFTILWPWPANRTSLKQTNCWKQTRPHQLYCDFCPISYLYVQTAMSYQDVLKAHARIVNFIHKTSVVTSSTLDKLAGRRLFFKCELFQKTGSFKARGALNAVSVQVFRLWSQYLSRRFLYRRPKCSERAPLISRIIFTVTWNE